MLTWDDTPTTVAPNTFEKKGDPAQKYSRVPPAFGGETPAQTAGRLALHAAEAHPDPMAVPTAKTKEFTLVPPPAAGATGLESLEMGARRIQVDDKKIINCRADLNQLVPFKYEWAWKNTSTPATTTGCRRKSRWPPTSRCGRTPRA